MARVSRGFTLVEMVVVAPVVILAIGAFIATIVNMTGEVMSSRGANAVTFEIQDSLNRIEQDIKLSTSFMAENSIELTGSNPQGLGADGLDNFTNVGGPGGAVLILGALATNGNPLSQGVGNIYINDAPNSCASGEYTSNTPLHINIVYFVDDDGVLWRRTIMPQNYNSSSLCGGMVWQQPSCTPGWSHSFCKTDDIKLLEGVSAADFLVEYYNTAASSSPSAQASNPSLSADERGAALQIAQTASISLSSNKNIAGRDVSRTGSLRVTRLDTNATSVAEIVIPNISAQSPTVDGVVVDGNNVKFTWQQLAGADSYTAQYRVSTNGGSTWGSWTNAMNGGSTSFPNTAREYTLTAASSNNLVELRVRGVNSNGSSAYGVKAVDIPLWTPLDLQNGWVNYNAGYSPAQFTRSKDGVVVITGLIRYGATDNYTLLGTLPPKYRPTHTLIFRAAEAGSNVSRVDVYADGRVMLTVSPSTATSWLSLNGITFLAHDAPVDRIPMTLLEGWTNYGGSFAPMTTAIDDSGRVHMQGLISSGTITSGTVMGWMPTSPVNHRSDASQYFSTLSGNSFNEVFFKHGLAATPITKSGWLSVQGMYYATGRGSWTFPTLQNGWTRYSTGFPDLQYAKGSDGIVTLRGLVKGGTTTNETVIANLPPGYRPGARQITSVANNHAHGRVDVTVDGNIVVRGPINNAWVSVDSISFMAEN